MRQNILIYNHLHKTETLRNPTKPTIMKITDVEAFTALEKFRLKQIPMDLAVECFGKVNPCLHTLISDEVDEFLTDGNYNLNRLGLMLSALTNEKYEVFKTIKRSICNIPEPQQPIEIETLKPENWDNEIEEMERCFANAAELTNPIKLDGCTTINNPALFIQSHLATIKANNGNKTFSQYLTRLQKLSKLT